MNRSNQAPIYTREFTLQLLHISILLALVAGLVHLKLLHGFALLATLAFRHEVGLLERLGALRMLSWRWSWWWRKLFLLVRSLRRWRKASLLLLLSRWSGGWRKLFLQLLGVRPAV